MTNFTIYDSAWADATATNELEALASAIETFTAGAANSDPFVAYVAGERLRAYQDVYDRRLASLRILNGKATQRDLDRQVWNSLVREVKHHVDVPTVLELGGIALTRHGHEYHSWCPVCSDGVDRLVSWPNPNSRCWCRRCKWRADVIAAAQSVIPSCDGFHTTVTWLADLARAIDGGAP
jgi:hypothetical protein